MSNSSSAMLMAWSCSCAQHAASVLAQAYVPLAVAAALALARMTALQTPDGGVRGIATGDVFRRLVSRALAKTWASTLNEATRPYQHAMSARTGMDALVARLRIALETDANVTVVSLDTIQCRALPSCASYTRWPPPFYRSCACSTGSLQSTAGGMHPGPASGANRAMP